MPQLPTFLFLNLLALTGAISSTLKQTRDDLSHPPLTVATAQQELGPLLSKNTSLYFPNSPEFANITDRWSPNTNSDYAVAVIPATAQDVAATVSLLIHTSHARSRLTEGIEGQICRYLQHPAASC